MEKTTKEQLLQSAEDIKLRTNQEAYNKVNCQTVLRIGKDIGRNVSLFMGITLKGTK